LFLTVCSEMPLLIRNGPRALRHSLQFSWCWAF
jgi:hypothetical protein